MSRSYKYCLYPSEKDEQELREHLDLCRQVYNHFLDELNDADEIPSRYELQKPIPPRSISREMVAGSSHMSF